MPEMPIDRHYTKGTAHFAAGYQIVFELAQ
jgi:hypothetical protein